MSLWPSPKLAGENIQEVLQAFPSLTDTILQQRSMIYAKFSLASNASDAVSSPRGACLLYLF